MAAGLLVDDTLHRLRFGGKGLHTDHIIPHRGDTALLNDIYDLQLLCAKEHDQKTVNEAGGFGRSAKRVVRRRQEWSTDVSTQHG